ncbi:MAG: cell division protein FtsA [Clostridiaceae bacterium]|nr:cell division protein FtsA [Clostridiaceae bacterium]
MDSVSQTVGQTQINLADIPEDLVFGLDIGTRSIVGTVGFKRNTRGFVVVAQVAMEHETRAMMDGQIHDIGQVAETIGKVKAQLEEMTGRSLKEVCIAAAGRVLKTVESEAQIHFNSETVVTSEHIYSLDMLGVEKAYDTLRQELQSDDVKFYCVGYSIKQYYQNDYPISNLEGHKCTDLKTELIATFLPDEVVDGLYAAVERAGLYVANLTLEPIAAINVAIPEKFRLLNLALVDVGAGTSDISITRDGSIIAYGMIPYAGDEITECVARRYLTDFTEADRMKCMSTGQEEVTYHDIMGLEQKIPSSDLVEAVSDTVHTITKNISDKIIELNGGKPVSAVFVVGGGGKVGGFVESIAEYQGLVKERVALRGSEVLGNVKFLQDDVQVDSLLVTPIGICLNYYEQKNNFIFVTVNGERIKLYDNNKLTVMDAAMQVGYPNEDLFPKRGDAIHYTIAGEKRMLRGEPGEAAVVRVNGKETGINAPIESNDKIEITASTKGKPAELVVGKLPEYKSSLGFFFNNRKINCSRFVLLNGELVSEFHAIQDEDCVEILDYYTLKQVLDFMDIMEYQNVMVNNVPADENTKVYENFAVLCDLEEQTPAQTNYAEQEQSSQDSPAEPMMHNQDSPAEPMMHNQDSPAEGAKQQGIVDVAITVNGDPVVLKNKKEYILVDVLDFYPIDTSIAHGDHLETLVNGVDCDFTKPIASGDQVQIQWVDN